MSAPEDITRLLREWRDGRPGAFEQLMPVVYADLKRIAVGYLRHERSDHTLQATGLVHELYLRLCNQRDADWNDRAHFYTFTAKVMRMILADHARRYHAEKRGGPHERVPLSDDMAWVNVSGPEMLDFDRALDALQDIDARKARMVELCHFLGCTTKEAAGILGVSMATAERDLKFARGWLYRQLYPPLPEVHA
ncbi:MAG: ECF-type sigma factor [Bryobacteraceae bacterium]|jgi:RNA polymerase sigma factor (TIGR02999 family)